MALVMGLLSVPTPALGRILAADSPTAIPGQYVVDIRDGLDVPAVAQALVAQHGGTIGHLYEDVLGGFSVAANETQAGLIAGDSRVERVEADQEGEETDVQVDPPNWGLDRIDQRTRPLDQRYHHALSNVTVYVIDSGIRLDHRELGGRARIGWSVDQVDYCPGLPGYHGTAVASNAAGSTVGVAKHASVVAVKVGRCAPDKVRYRTQDMPGATTILTGDQNLGRAQLRTASSSH